MPQTIFNKNESSLDAITKLNPNTIMDCSMKTSYSMYRDEFNKKWDASILSSVPESSNKPSRSSMNNGEKIEKTHASYERPGTQGESLMIRKGLHIRNKSPGLNTCLNNTGRRNSRSVKATMMPFAPNWMKNAVHLTNKIMSKNTVSSEKVLQVINKLEKTNTETPRQVHLSKVRIKPGNLGKMMGKRDNSFALKKMMHPKLLNSDFLYKYPDGTEKKKLMSLGHIDTLTLEPPSKSSDRMKYHLN
jgi:hypothetical protein